MDMATALADLGVAAGSIDSETRSRLDRDGNAPLPGVLSAAQLAVIRARLGELLAAEGDRAGLEVRQEEGTDRLADLNKDPAFEVCFTDPRLLACVAHVLGEFKLSSLNYRAALPGQGLQALHNRRRPGHRSRRIPGVQFDLAAGRLHGGQRRDPRSAGVAPVRRSPGDVMADRRDSHPGEVLLLAPTGTVVVFNYHLWHGGTLNRSSRPRRALHAYFTRRGNGQQLDQRKYARPETLARLGPTARFILDV